ncbi:uncharacterized protein EI90DRAFT_3118626 [Cantharellus anzutake]|uniref:uncharacterized protein n=1 Tax=Cantharellus anzutake TaxID=1750568 RepID=UPI00190879E4|nr:uncharacterized protein EI90DRAFT_3118626 [Cantharellus anzutake]KAF8338199.1 hypothetical protein EI90DRAFT_3118626 [Cantharellus anzutake]
MDLTIWISLWHAIVLEVCHQLLQQLKTVPSDGAIRDAIGEEVPHKAGFIKTSPQRFGLRHHTREVELHPLCSSNLNPVSSLSTQSDLEAIVSSRLFETSLAICLPPRMKVKQNDLQPYAPQSQDAPKRPTHRIQQGLGSLGRAPAEGAEELTRAPSSERDYAEITPSVHPSSTNPSWTPLMNFPPARISAQPDLK